MFGKQKKRPEPEDVEEPEKAVSPSANAKRAEKPEPEEIAAHIDAEISHAKSALGGYLRMLDDVRAVA